MAGNAMELQTTKLHHSILSEYGSKLTYEDQTINSFKSLFQKGRLSFGFQQV